MTDMNRHGDHAHSNGHYMHLAVMTALSFIAMYILMYAMVDRFANVYANINQFYMAGLMTAPMVIIELIVMHTMYADTKMNLIFGVAALVALVLCFAAIRVQTAVGDVQFVRSMIPHHSGAILMCNKATLVDGELKKLCATIVKGQQQEIDEMNAILIRLSK